MSHRDTHGYKAVFEAVSHGLQETVTALAEADQRITDKAGFVRRAMERYAITAAFSCSSYLAMHESHHLNDLIEEAERQGVRLDMKQAYIEARVKAEQVFDARPHLESIAAQITALAGSREFA
jgi:predicted chitinase